MIDKTLNADLWPCLMPCSLELQHSLQTELSLQEELEGSQYPGGKKRGGGVKKGYMSFWENKTWKVLEGTLPTAKKGIKSCRDEFSDPSN